jgi:hypothetical protein
MKLLTTTSALIFIMSVAGCSSSAKIKYPEKQTNLNQASSTNSQLITAKSAYQFEDKDIEVPSNFNVQGINNCTFDVNNESDGCPLKKPVVRVYFAGNNNASQKQEERQALETLNNKTLGLMFESQLAGLNRFRIVTQDDVTSQEMGNQIKEQSAKTLANVMKNNKTLRPDYVLKVDTIKTANRFYAEYNGMAQYAIELTVSVIDPFTKEKLSYPNIGKIRIDGTDVKSKHELVYTEVNGRYYTGFDYTNPDNINAVFNKMASKAFDIMLSRMLIEMPVSAQVTGLRGDQITLDRGRNAGVLTDDTFILFKYDGGFVDPIAVAIAKPSSESAIAKIVKWKESDIANELKQKAAKGIYRPNKAEQIFAVSVGLPNSYIKTKM